MTSTTLFRPEPNIWVPYTAKVPQAVAAIERFSPHYAWMDDKDNYPCMLRDLWKLREKVIIVEHDVIPPDGGIEELWACEQPWCGFSYGESFQMSTPTLGCVKLSPEFMEQTDGMWEALLEGAVDRERNPYGLSIFEKKWKMCDIWMDMWTRTRGIKIHQHFPWATNLRDTLNPRLY